jgi:hypothetical protein
VEKSDPKEEREASEQHSSSHSKKKNSLNGVHVCLQSSISTYTIGYIFFKFDMGDFLKMCQAVPVSNHIDPG